MFPNIRPILHFAAAASAKLLNSAREGHIRKHIGEVVRRKGVRPMFHIDNK